MKSCYTTLDQSTAGREKVGKISLNVVTIYAPQCTMLLSYDV